MSLLRRRGELQSYEPCQISKMSGCALPTCGGSSQTKKDSRCVNHPAPMPRRTSIHALEEPYTAGIRTISSSSSKPSEWYNSVLHRYMPSSEVCKALQRPGCRFRRVTMLMEAHFEPPYSTIRRANRLSNTRECFVPQIIMMSIESKQSRIPRA